MRGECGRGIIITRDRDKQVRPLQLNEYLIQTNMDHWRGSAPQDAWQNIEWSLQRRDFARRWMTSQKRESSLDGTRELMDTEPVRAFDTIYTTAMCPKEGIYDSCISD